MTKSAELDPDYLPRHIAIIMDGNGRWAQKLGLVRTLGHKAGVDSVREVVKVAREIGIQVLTLYAFSTENWKRPESEVSTLMNLLKTYLEKEVQDLCANNISLRCIGQIDKLPADVRAVLAKVIADTSSNTGMVLNLALSYGSRSELTKGIQEIARQCVSGKLSVDNISEETISSHLYTAGLPDPDLLIRTGGESRLSNFLLWQVSYSELYFSDTFWPKFRKAELIEAIKHFQARQRRFGKTGEQVKKQET
jgi:undecaprenyl diphosphate synthase